MKSVSSAGSASAGRSRDRAVDRRARVGLVCGVPSHASGLVDAHVHLSFATHGETPAPRGSAAIQELYLRAQADAGVTLVRDCGAIPEAVAPPAGPGLPVVVACGPLLAPDIPFGVV